MPSESERVGDTEGQIGLDCCVRSVVEVALRIRSVEVDGRRADAVTEGKHRAIASADPAAPNMCPVMDLMELMWAL